MSRTLDLADGGNRAADPVMSRRGVLKAGALVAASVGLGGCAAQFVARPLVKYAIDTAITAFASSMVSALADAFGSSAQSAITDLSNAAQHELTDIWAADISTAPVDTIVAGLYKDDGRQSTTLQPFLSEPRALPTVVQIGLNAHAVYVLRSRRGTDWKGSDGIRWNELSESQCKERLRRELVVVAAPTLLKGSTDVTREAQYLCLLSGELDAKGNNNILVEWTPSTDDNKQTELRVRRGVYTAASVTWEPDYDFDPIHIPSQKLWEKAKS
jgi:hypothetical protein